MPKHRRAWSGLYVLGMGLVWLARHLHLAGATSGLVSSLGLLSIAVGMSVQVAGMIGDRKDWERQQANSEQSQSHVV